VGRFLILVVGHILFSLGFGDLILAPGGAGQYRADLLRLECQQ